VVVLVALLAATVMGHLHVNTEEIQLMQNHIHGVEALAVAEAGLHDALAHLRLDAGWSQGFVDKPFRGGSYSVTVRGSTIASAATTARGFVARIEADVTVASHGPPYIIEIEELRINP
jgi:hypothetical protein